MFVFPSTDHVPRPSRTGRERDDNPAGHQARGRGARPGVRVHGRGHRARPHDGRFRDGGRCAGHRPVAGPAPAPGNVHGPAAAAPARLSAGRQRLRAARAANVAAQDPAAAQDHGNPDAVSLGAELPAAVRGSQILGPQDHGSEGRHSRGDRGQGTKIKINFRIFFFFFSPKSRLYLSICLLIIYNYFYFKCKIILYGILGEELNIL